MNLLLVCCLCLILHKASPQEFFQYSTDEETLYEEIAENCDTSGVVGCTLDCSGLQYCFMNDLISIPCAEGKYCDKYTNTCVTSIDNCTVELKPPFKCPGNGYYPYAIDCHKLWDCTTSTTAHVLSCGDLIFDVLKNRCTESSDDVQCRTFSTNDLCSTQNIFATHPRNEAIYAFCKGNFPQIDVCPENHIFNTTDFKCTFECTETGRFKDPNNPEWYYSCNGTKVDHIHCGNGKIFNDQLKTCSFKKP